MNLVGKKELKQIGAINYLMLLSIYAIKCENCL